MRLGAAVTRLVANAARHFGDCGDGEMAAIIERSRAVLAWITAEAEDREDRSRRYARQRAVLNLLELCEGVRQFHRPGKRKATEVAAFRALIAEAVRELVPE